VSSMDNMQHSAVQKLSTVCKGYTEQHTRNN
jgi:hypothetical protein